MAKKPMNRPVAKATPAAPVGKKTVQKGPIERSTIIKYLCLVLAGVSFIVYANTLQNGFVLDDTMVLKENLYVKQGIKAIPELLATPHMRGYMVIPNDLYRPLSLVMFAVEYQFFGLEHTGGYHFFNILTFIGCVIMLFLFLDKFFNREKIAIAFIAAFIFAVHPIHTEVVANIKSRDELLCYFFAFLSLNLFMNYMKEGRMMQFVLGIISFYLSLISKETVVTLVPIVPILFFFYNNEDRKRAGFITGGAFAVTGLFLVIRYMVLKKYDADQPGAPVDFIDNALSQAPSFASKLATEFYIIGKYLLMVIVPYPLISNYSFKAIPFMTFGDIGVLLSIAAYGAMIYLIITRFRKDQKDPWVFAMVFFMATISLFSNFPFLMGAEMAERFTFFASTGMCIAVALAVDKWVLKAEAADPLALKGGKALMILVPFLVVFGGLTFARNYDWKDEYTLYRKDVEKSPNDARLHQYLGTAIAENVYPEEQDTVKRKELDKESEGYLKHALEIYPDFAEAHVELGRVYERMRRYKEAVDEDLKALKLKPMNATANNNMGSVYITLGKYRDAIPYLLKSAEINPNFKFVYLNLGRTFRAVQSYDSAIVNYRKLLGFDPNYLDGVKELATCYYLKQKYDSAAIYFKQVADAMPNDADAANNLGAVYLNGKRFPQAIEQFSRAISLNPNYINAYSNLARSYYLSGKYEQAIDMINKELKLNPKQVNDVPYIALSFQKMGKMDEARKYEAIAKQIYPDFHLE